MGSCYSAQEGMSTLNGHTEKTDLICTDPTCPFRYDPMTKPMTIKGYTIFSFIHK